MAQKVEMVLVDDLDGDRAQESVRFGVDGRHYELDLSAPNAKQLRSALQACIRLGRLVTTSARGPAASKIRQWARDNGYEIAARGRIQRTVIEAYYAADT